MATQTWDQLNAGSWDNPLIAPVAYTDTIVFPTLTPQEIVVKLRQGFRFLRAYYELFLTTDGTSRTAPARIYSITLELILHANVSKEVS